MGQPISDFGNVIAPVLPAAFFAKTWERKPLHISRSRHDFYQDLLAKRDVDQAISSGGLRFPSIQLAKGGRFLPPEAFTRSIRSGDDLFSGVPIPERIRDEYKSGATIALPSFHRAWKPLGALAASIEAELSHAVHANVYLTPPKAAGFTPHFDTHEVFVLQIAGTKHWKIHAPPIELPHRSQMFDAGIDAPSATLLELDLAAGDLLYLPRGYVHSTETSDSFSVHVALGITVYTWVELLVEWAQSSKGGARFRRALPPGFAASDNGTEALKVGLHELIGDLQRNTDFDALARTFAGRVRSARLMTTTEFDADMR